MTTRRLDYTYANSAPAFMVLIENDGTPVVTYTSHRSFRCIDRYGRTFRLAGRDRETGEMIYVPDTVAA